MPQSTLSNDRQVYRLLILILLFVAALIVSAYAIFLLQHILIIYPAIHILTLAIAVEISLLIPVWIVLLVGYVKGESIILSIAGVIIILWLAPQATFIASVEYDYNAVENEYGSFTSGEHKAGDEVSTVAWNISKKYLDSFSSCRNDIRNPVPVRSIYPENEVYGFHLLLYHYLFGMNGLDKLTAADGRGNCSEYAKSVSLLVNRTLKAPSRFVILHGYDHKFAEVLTEKGWLILDPLKTTPDSPVMAGDYAEHLNRSNPLVYNSINGISSADGQSLLLNHGFKEA